MLNKIWRKHKERIANGGSESITFKTKRLKNHGKSDLTWKYYPLEKLSSFQMAHILAKGLYPELRNNVNNIVFVDSIEQHEWVDRTTAGKKFLVEQLVMHWEAVSRLKDQWDFYVKQKNGEESKSKNLS